MRALALTIAFFMAVPAIQAGEAPGLSGASTRRADRMGPFYCRQAPCAMNASVDDEPVLCVAWCQEDEVARGVTPASKRRAAVAQPKVQVIASPRISLAIPGGRLVRVLVLIEDPGPSWYCPKVTFDWAEGHRSTVEGDCAPYEKLTEEGRRWFRLMRTMRYGEGDHEIVVTISQGAERIQLSRRVSVN